MLCSRAPSPTSHAAAHIHQPRQRIGAMARALRPAQHLQLLHVEQRVYGLSQRETAEYLGIAESTVEKHIARGTLNCWNYLESRGLLSTPTQARVRKQHDRWQRNG